MSAIKISVKMWTLRDTLPNAVIEDAWIRLSFIKKPRTLSIPTSNGIPAIMQI